MKYVPGETYFLKWQELMRLSSVKLLKFSIQRSDRGIWSNFSIMFGIN